MTSMILSQRKAITSMILSQRKAITSMILSLGKIVKLGSLWFCTIFSKSSYDLYNSISLL